MKRKIVTKAPTFGSCFADFIIEKKAEGLSENTLKTYVTHIGAVEHYIDLDTPIEAVTSTMMKRMVARLADSDLSRNSIRSYTATLHSFLRWCRDNDLCDAEIALFKGEETIPETYTTDELKRLLKRPNKRASFAEYRAWTIVNLLVNDGCRAGTIRAIQNRDVNLDGHCIVLRHTKTRKVISIPLCDSLCAILKEYMRIRGGAPEDYLFCAVDGSQMSENCLRHCMERYNHSRGVEKTGIHKYRHTFARMYLVDCGGDSLKLQKLLGHSTLDMTKHYAHVFDADVIADANRMSPLDNLQKNIKKFKITS